jgi:hypothetical protein
MPSPAAGAARRRAPGLRRKLAEQRLDLAQRPGRHLHPVHVLAASEEAAHRLLDDPGLVRREGHVALIGRAGP